MAIEAPILNRIGRSKTLVFCPIGLGNFVMVSPALRLLSEEIGAENLHILALKSGIKEMAAASGLFGKVHFWNPDAGSTAAGFSVIARLRMEKYENSISLFPTGDWRFALVSFLVHAKNRIGFRYPNSRIPERVQTYSMDLDYGAHDTDQNCALIENVFSLKPQTARQPFFPFSEPEKVQESNLYYVCHPGSSAERGMSEKRLPPDRFADIINRIGEEFGLKCRLLGGPEEAGLRGVIKDLAGKWVVDEPAYSFTELALAIGNSQFYLGNDSGLMHIAAAKGKRCIAIFGPTDDKRNGPYSGKGEPKHLIIRNDELSCSPCWTIRTIGANPPCIHGDTRCLRMIDIDAVWSKIKPFIDTAMSGTAIDTAK